MKRKRTPSGRAVLCAAARELFRGEVRFDNRVQLPSARRSDVSDATLQLRPFLVIIMKEMRITIIKLSFVSVKVSV